MQIGMRGRLAVAIAAASLLGLAAGCDEDKKKDSGAVDAGTDDGGPPVNAGRLGAALASAAAAGAPPPAASASAGQGQGPPESGVFAAGAGEAALPKGTPFKMELLGQGSEPRALLAPKIDPKVEQKSSVLLGIRMGGPQGLPSIDVTLSLKVDKPKKDAKAGEVPAGTTVVGKVASAMPASMSLGGPAKELTDALGKLKGSTIRYRLSPANAVSDISVEVAKGAEPGLAALLDALGESASALTPPLPDKPVGVGAYWMVTDRILWQGAKIPLLRYRVFKITGIEPSGAVTLSVDTRQYAEDGVAKLPTGAQEVDTTIDAFESSGKGTLVWDPGAIAPRQAELSQRLNARLVPPGAPAGSPQRMVIQSELAARFQPPAAASP